MQRTTISMFAQLVQLMGGKIEFQNLVTHYQSDKEAKGLTTWSQFIAMLFCQLTRADSLREISDGLYSSPGKLSNIGATAVCRSTLSYANSKRPYKLYEDFYFVLLKKFRHEIQGRLGNRFTKPVFSPDSTTISLCLRLFEWAQHRRRNKTSHAFEQRYFTAGTHRGNASKGKRYQGRQRNIRGYSRWFYRRYG